jgi:putative aldouronate transport system substrate-binding protein
MKRMRWIMNRKHVIIAASLIVIIGLFIGWLLIGGGWDANRKDSQESKLLNKPEVSMLISSHENWPFNRDWWIWKELEKRTGVTLNLIETQTVSYGERLNILLVSGRLPDIVKPSKIVAETYGEKGVFLDINQYIDKMKNLKVWKNKYPESYDEYFSVKGKLFLLPNEGMGEGNRRMWLYRKDIFEKHNLKVPQNNEELYEVLLRLKQLYPDSYPLSFRSGVKQFEMIAPQWGVGSQSLEGFYFDSKNNQCYYAPVQDNYKQMITFYNMLYKQKLIPMDILTLDTKQWQDLISNNKTFITIDYASRIDFFNQPMRKENPEFTLTFMPPPSGDKNGAQRFDYTGLLPTSSAINAKSNNLDAVLSFVDFFYSDEGYELVSWGKAGTTYSVKDGKRKFINAESGVDVKNKYGLGTSGTYLWYDFEAEMSFYSEELRESIKESKRFEMERPKIPALTETEMEFLRSYGEAINKVEEDNTAKFLIGTRDLKEWDKYVNEINNLKLPEMIEIYQRAYNRMGKKIR